MIMVYNSLVDSFITFLLDPHEEDRSSNPSSIFWTKEGRGVAEIIHSENIWLHPKIWKEISIQFGLDYDETQFVIKTWLEKNYELGELTPRSLVPG